ncbi:hypothetical protein Tco_1204568, partial [Tanacetum coccineum]
PQNELLHTETPPPVSHEPQTEANIEQILPSPSTYQRKHRKTQKHRRAKKPTELPQTSMPLDLGADEDVHKEEVTVLDLEREKDAQAVEILKLKQRVESSGDDLDEEDASKQGRTTDKTKPKFIDFDDLDDLVDKGMAFTLIKMKEEKAKAKGVAIKDVEDSSRPIRSITTLQHLPTIDLKDKGKGVLVEKEPEKLEKVKRRDQGLAQIEKYDTIQASIDADALFAARLQQEEREQFTIEERAQFLKSSKKQKDYQKIRNDKRDEDRSSQTIEHEQEVLKNVVNSCPQMKRDCGSERFYAEKGLDRQDLMECTDWCMKDLKTILQKKRNPLIKEMLEKMLNWKLEAKVESTMAFELLKFIKSQLED